MGCGQSTEYKDFTYNHVAFIFVSFSPLSALPLSLSPLLQDGYRQIHPPYDPGPAQEFFLVMLWVSINVPETILTVRDAIGLVKLTFLKEPPK